MPNKIITRNTKNGHLKDRSKYSTEQLLSTNEEHEINKKQPESGAKRYKVLLTCVICEGDAHGKLIKTKLIS